MNYRNTRFCENLNIQFCKICQRQGHELFKKRVEKRCIRCRDGRGIHQPDLRLHRERRARRRAGQRSVYREEIVE